MVRSSALIFAALLTCAGPASADTTDAAQSRGFRPIWTSVGAGAGFGLGVWIGLAKFDDAIDSDRKVWTTALVSAAAGGILGFFVDRHRARSGNPSRLPSVAPRAKRQPWRQEVYGSPSSAASLRLPPVDDLLRR